MKIEDIDKNFVLPNYDGYEIEWHNVKEEPISVFGLLDVDGRFARVPKETLKNVNQGVSNLTNSTAGGRVRFKTDSPYIAFSAKTPKMYINSAMREHGIDVYCDDAENSTFINSAMANFTTKQLKWLLKVDERSFYKGLHNYTVNMPLYSDIEDFYIGIKKGCSLFKTEPYEDKLPIVYYGSSITQGAFASRPGMSYQNIICRRNNVDYINLGFSGSAKGEPAMAEYIAAIPMSVFVYDYDYNAPTADELKKTHKPFYDIVRKKNPDIPIIMLSRPCVNINDSDHRQRRDIVKETYEIALKNNENVYFIDGSTIFEGQCANDCTIDYVHPTDIGFMYIAKRIGDILEKLL